MLGKILTTDNLRKTAILIADWCCICTSNREFVDHILLHRSIAKELWGILLCLFGVSWVMPNLVTAMLGSWKE